MNTGPGKLPSLCSLYEMSRQTHHGSRIITLPQSTSVRRRESSRNCSNMPSATVLQPHLVQHHCSPYIATLCNSSTSPTIKQPSFLGKPPACVSGNVPLMIWQKIYLMHDRVPPHFSLAALPFLTCAYPAWWLGRGRPSIWTLLSLLYVQKKSVIKNCPTKCCTMRSDAATAFWNNSKRWHIQARVYIQDLHSFSMRDIVLKFCHTLLGTPIYTECLLNKALTSSDNIASKWWYDSWKKNCEEFVRKHCGLIWHTVLEFAWRNWGKQKISRHNCWCTGKDSKWSALKHKSESTSAKQLSIWLTAEAGILNQPMTNSEELIVFPLFWHINHALKGSWPECITQFDVRCLQLSQDLEESWQWGRWSESFNMVLCQLFKWQLLCWGWNRNQTRQQVRSNLECQWITWYSFILYLWQKLCGSFVHFVHDVGRFQDGLKNLWIKSVGTVTDKTKTRMKMMCSTMWHTAFTKVFFTFKMSYGFTVCT